MIPGIRSGSGIFIHLARPLQQEDQKIVNISEFEIPAKATMQKNNSSSRCISSLLFLS
jgi:hypothetical protein